MPRKTPTLCVVLNPFTHLDHDGRPSATVLIEPDPHHPTQDRRLVGSEIRAEVLEKRVPVNLALLARGIQNGDNRPSVHEIWWEHSAESVTVPDTAYYRQRIAERTLLVADDASARRLGTKLRPPSEVILETARQAAKVWAREHDGETPEWASDLPHAEMHASHATHARLVVAHVAKIPATIPPAAPTKPETPHALASEPEGAI